MFYGSQGATGVRGDTGTIGDTGIGIRGDTRTIGHYDTGAAVIGDTRYAAIEFDEQLKKVLEDGITKQEAIRIVDRHNKLQRMSRFELQSVLELGGHRAYIQESQLTLKRERRYHGPVRVELPPLTNTDSDTKNIRLTKIDRRKIPQKAVWFAIVVPSVFASLLGVLGVI
jgi:hypothetical protein